MVPAGVDVVRGVSGPAASVLGPGFGPPPGVPGFGPPPGRRRRNRGDVRAAVLRVLADGPMHGYQIIQELTARSGGVWRPSPGAVYPTLAQLEDEGLVTGRQDEGRNVFELTETGRTEAERVGQDPRAPWATEDDLVNLHEQFEQLAGAIGQVARAGSPAQRAEAARLVTEARRAVYRVLAEDDQPAPVGGSGEGPAA